MEAPAVTELTPVRLITTAMPTLQKARAIPSAA
jgi:hypothetical protein